MIRTTTNGTDSFRFTAGQPDGLNTPDTLSPDGQIPFVWMTGGGTLASADPATAGMTVKLQALTDAGYSVAQPNVPWLLGNPTATDRINDAVAWGRANLGWSDDPPILFGVSNGWVCAIVYARQFDVTCVIGILPVTGGRDGYYSEDPTLRGLGLRERIQTAWGVTHPQDPSTGPILAGSDSPDRWTPYDDVRNSTNYPDLTQRVQMWYSADDPLLVGHEMAFGKMIRAEMHNVGDWGHLGSFFDASQPVDHADTTAIVEFVNRFAT